MPRIKRWFKLDNAAKLYPAVSTSRWSSIFRVSAELNAPVNPALLQQALDLVLPRFPALKVRIKAGLFWYYLEEIREPLTVRPDLGHPCMPFRYRQDRSYLFRVFYYQNRISAEFFHVLTDGTGGMTFLKTLTVQYLRLCGHDVAWDQGALDPAQPADPMETQDTFTHMPLPKVRVSRSDPKAYQFPGTAEIPHTLNTIAASIPCAPLKEKAKMLGISVTEYLVSIILYVGYMEQKKHPQKRLKPLRVSVPVNMRTFYSTATLRNFSSFINPDIDPRLGDYTFEEIAGHVHAFMHYHLSPKLLFATIATNVSDERYLFTRLAPLFIKNLIIGSVFHRTGERTFTATFSNLGVTKIPTGGQPYIRRFEMQLGAPSRPMCNCAAVTTGDELRLIYSSTIRETTLPREMLRYLVEQGIPVTVESNKKGG
ncbi:MAG: alcohol acetyltransferase [Clostridiales bacterium]|nr:alcohol acetyltransferase [Clostridiales bacterium]